MDEWFPLSRKETVRRIVSTLKQAYLSLLRQRLRAWLSVLGVICGVVAVFSMISISEGAKLEAIRQVEALGAQNILIRSKGNDGAERGKTKGSGLGGVNRSDAKRIAKMDASVSSVAMVKDIKASLIGAYSEVSPRIIAVTENYAHVQALELEDGRFIINSDSKEKRLVCVLGAQIAAKLGSSGRLGENLRIDNADFRVVGILRSRKHRTSKRFPVSTRDYNQMVIIPFGSQSVLKENNYERVNPDKSNGSISEFVVQIKRRDLVERSAQVIRRVLSLAHGGILDYTIIVPLEILRNVKQTQRTFNIVMGAIAGISMLVGGIGIMNVMLAMITERKREIGIRRAIGATQKHIMVQFVAESVILTFVGGVLGVIVGIVFIMFISLYSGWETVISIWGVALSLGMSVLAGGFFGYYPAYLAARTDPIIALKGE